MHFYACNISCYFMLNAFWFCLVFFFSFNSIRRRSKSGGSFWTLRTGSCCTLNISWWGETLICVQVLRQVRLRSFSFIILVCFNAGRRGVRGYFHRHRGQRLLSEGVWTQESSRKQVELWHRGADARAFVCLHVWAGEGEERVAAGPDAGPVQTHDTTGLYQ